MGCHARAPFLGEVRWGLEHKMSGVAVPWDTRPDQAGDCKECGPPAHLGESRPPGIGGAWMSTAKVSGVVDLGETSVELSFRILPAFPRSTAAPGPTLPQRASAAGREEPPN